MTEIPYNRLSPEAGNYLESAGVCFGTPIDRLRKMNMPAVELYRSKGVDVENLPLEELIRQALKRMVRG